MQRLFQCVDPSAPFHFARDDKDKLCSTGRWKSCGERLRATARVAPTGKLADFRASVQGKHLTLFCGIFVDGFPGLAKLESKKISKN